MLRLARLDYAAIGEKSGRYNKKDPINKGRLVAAQKLAKLLGLKKTASLL